MGSGLSMTSVNKIKELAAAHEYSVAVEILDSQDLEKSLNPQFLRVCGEVYENVGRWNDARALYVKAHSMAPDAKRILFSIISLYLKMGYFSLADEYYQQYVFQTGKDTQEINNINYIMNKAREASCEELFELLYPHYADAMDETWSFELFLVAAMLRKEDLIDRLAADYCATFKSSRYCRDIEDIKTGRKKAEEFFDIYAKTVREDDDEACEEIRQFEKKQLKEDYYRMFPKEPEILDMEDDDSEIPKRVLKKLNRKEKKNRKDGEADDDIEDGNSEPATDPDDSENLTLDEKTEAVKKGLKSVIRKKFKKKKEEPETKVEEPETKVEEPETKVEEPETKVEEPETKAEEPETKVEEPETKVEEPETKVEEPETKVEAPETKVEDEPEIIIEPEEDWEEEAEEDTVQLEDDKEAVDSQDGNDKESEDMQELRPESSLDDIVTYDFDDGFAPESDTISGLSGDFEEDYANPFDSINAYKIDDRERRMSEAALSGKSMEDMRIELEINNVDDSENLSSEDLAVDEDISENADVSTEEKADVSTEENVDAAAKENIDVDADENVDAAAEENAEEEVIITSDFESDDESDFEPEDFDSDFDSDDFEIQIGDSEIEAFDDTAEEINLEEAEPEEIDLEEAEPEEINLEEAEPEEIDLEEAEPEEIDFEEAEPEEIDFEEAESEEIDFEEAEPEEIDFEEAEPEEIEPEKAEPEKPEQTETQNTEYQPTLDYPEFKSSLFPNLNRKQEEVQNTFDSVMKEEQEKLQERLLQEEKMQREAEELLASLGIKL